MGSAAFKSAKNRDIKRTKIIPINIRRENTTIEGNTNDNKQYPPQDDELKNIGCFSFSRRPNASSTGITRSRNKSESKILEVSDSSHLLQQNIPMSTENSNAIISTPVVSLTSQEKETTTASSVTNTSVHPTPTVSECSLPKIPSSPSNLIRSNNLVGVSEKCNDKSKESVNLSTICLPKMLSTGKQNSESLSSPFVDKSTLDQPNNVCEPVGMKDNVSEIELDNAVSIISTTQKSNTEKNITSVACVKTKNSNSTTENRQIYVTSKSGIETSCLQSNVKEIHKDNAETRPNSDTEVTVPETLGELLNRREPLQPSTLYAFCESQMKQDEENRLNCVTSIGNTPSSLFPKKLPPVRLEPITATSSSCDGCTISKDLSLRLASGRPPVPPPAPPPQKPPQPSQPLGRPPSAQDIQRQAMEEGLQARAGRGGCGFFLPSTRDGLQTPPPPRPLSSAGRAPRSRRSTLSSEEKMLMAQVNRQLQLAKRREFARRNNLQVSRVSSACSLRAASPAPGLGGAQGDTPAHQPVLPAPAPAPPTKPAAPSDTADLPPRPPAARPPSGKAPPADKSTISPRTETPIITVIPTTTTTTDNKTAAAAVPEDAPAAGDSTAVGVKTNAKLGSAGRTAAKPLTPAEIAAKSFMEDIFKEFEDI